MGVFKKKPELEVGESPPPLLDPTTPGASAEEKPAPRKAAPADSHPNPQPKHVPSDRRVAE